jgi:hypothetical protein
MLQDVTEECILENSFIDWKCYVFNSVFCCCKIILPRTVTMWFENYGRSLVAGVVQVNVVFCALQVGC